MKTTYGSLHHGRHFQVVTTWLAFAAITAAIARPVTGQTVQAETAKAIGPRHAPIVESHDLPYEPVAREEGRIRTSPEHPRFWEYKGRPVLLLGGTDDDNLFQWNASQLTDHLDLLVRSGGNYVRNTLSARDSGNVQPFRRLEDGRFDLDAWNPEYWDRLSRLLREAALRDVIVQIEIWAFHDVAREHWLENPWNPANNVNYGTTDTRLRATDYGDYWTSRHDFFYSVPALHADTLVLAYQRRFVDRLLSVTLEYGNVLYCITNEIFTQYSPEWGWYWGRYVKERAGRAGAAVSVTEMYQNHDVEHEQHRASFDRPDVFDFVDVSQNSRMLDQEHWDKLQWVRRYLSDDPRPINHTKTYGGDAVEWTDGDAHGIERFWRSLLGGAAAVRFHRPPSGIGLGSRAQAHLKSARSLAGAFDFFQARPDAESALLSSRRPDEAYLSYVPGRQYALYFPDGGSIGLDLSGVFGRLELRWLDLERSRWEEPEELRGGGIVDLSAPGAGNWVALVSK